MSDAAAEITDLHRSKLLGTLRVLCFRPGLLTLENFTGRRVRYLKPITLVLAVFALHLFAFTAGERAPGFDVLAVATAPPTAPVDDIRVRLGKSIERKAARSGVTTESLAGTINDKWVRNFSLVQIPLILILALWTSLILFFSRRHFVEHVVFSMHLISFTGLTVVLMWPVIHFAQTGSGAGMLWITGFKFVFDCVWVALAIRRVYQVRTGMAVFLAVLVQGGYKIAFTLAHQLALSFALRSVLAG